MIQTLKTLWDTRGSAWKHFAACALAGCTIFLGSMGPGVAPPRRPTTKGPATCRPRRKSSFRMNSAGSWSSSGPPRRPERSSSTRPERFLYLVQPNNRALRFGIGVGREGFQWTGLKRIDRKAEWPDWTPPPEMIARQPYLPRFMAGGPGNPMGARALYISGTVYRIHGTNAPAYDRDSGFLRLFPTDQSRTHRSL